MRALDDFTTWLKKALTDMLKPWEDKVKNACPSGMICWFYITQTESVSGTTRIKSPDGWIVCDGRTYSVNGTTKTAPNLCGTYNYICGTNVSSKVGKTLDPGLPNIKGTVSFGACFIDGTGGAFRKADTLNGGTGGSQTGKLTDDFNFDASRSSSVYQDGFNKVQPASTQLVPCMKI